MELSRRESSVLQRAVERYIQAGVPVASHYVAEHREIELSSASVRNVMADLEEAGYLDRSHASAGCVPTDRGFRFYVDSLRPQRRLPIKMKRSVVERMNSMQRELVEDLEWVPQLVADVTREAGVAVRPMGEDPVVEAVSLVPLVDGRLLGVVVTADGCIEKRALSLDKDMSRSEIERIANTLNRLFVGRPLDWIRSHHLVVEEPRAEGSPDTSSAPMHEVIRTGDRLREVATKLFSIAPDEAQVVVAGTENLLMSADFDEIDRARSLMVVFKDRGRLVREWRRLFSAGNTQVAIGRESEVTASGSLGMVATLFFRGGRRVGALGVVGPRRMNYLHIVPIVEFIGESLTKMLDGRGASHG
jgi:heat-inducible transcriptional repressor